MLTLPSIIKAKRCKPLKHVSLDVQRGDIYGVVGYSGAGKSTLVRVINRLQRPTAGQVIVNGQDILAMKAKDLRQARTKIGMIFQHFNLMNARTIADNVDYPLKGGS
jgi:ABC-type metal ion transport system, ATPase component